MEVVLIFPLCLADYKTYRSVLALAQGNCERNEIVAVQMAQNKKPVLLERLKKEKISDLSPPSGR
jgi:hypothetical protein